jgi:hypothetical protein
MGRPRLRPFESLFRSLQRSAAGGNRDCTLSYEEFVKFTALDRCHYCWSPIRWSEYNININGNGHNLDRKDSLRGYTPDNVVVCCSICNWHKGGYYDYETWFAMTEVLRNRKQGGQQ